MPWSRQLRLTVSLVSFAFGPTAFAGPALPNDPDFALQWALHNVGQFVAGQTGTPGADIGAVEAWQLYPGDRSITVAIVGRGVSPHPEFADRLLEGFATAGDLYDSLDGCGYDTQLAGIIAAAADNGAGIAGVSGHALILPVRVATGCAANEGNMADGIRRAADEDAKIILVPMQSTLGNDPLAEAVAYAASRDCLVIAPAGGNADGGEAVVAFPARFEGCIAVSATTNRDELSSFSNFGPQVDIAAPGRGIWSTDADGDYGYVAEGRDASAAAAFVAGTAALLWSFNLDLTAGDVRQILLSAADDLGDPGPDPQFGAGRVNAGRALAIAPPPAIRFQQIDPFPETILPGLPTSFRVGIIGVTEGVVPGFPSIVYQIGASKFQFHTLFSLGNDVFRVEIPPILCGATLEYYLVAVGDRGTIVFDPPGAPGHMHRAQTTVRQVVFADDMETDAGWTAEGNEFTGGGWSRVPPAGTTAQPDFDYSPDAGQFCFVTGQHFGGLDGNNDVDGGPVVLTSPAIDIPAGEIEISYARWFHWSGVGQEDFLVAEVSRDDGQTWTVVETVAGNLAVRTQWAEHHFRLSEFPSLQGNRLRMRFSVADDPDDSLTEAAIDEFRVETIACAARRGDADLDGDVDLLDFQALFACWSGPHQIPGGENCAAADLNASGPVDLGDFAVLQSAFGIPAD